MPAAPPAIVVDTNAVLDCFVFGDPRSRALCEALEAGAVHWLATAPMRDELLHVLGRGLGPRWPADATAVAAVWDRHARVVAPPAAAALRCSDPDDQMFLDLALGLGVPWLVSRDRALLRLAGAARRLGLRVVTPASWQAAVG